MKHWLSRLRKGQEVWAIIEEPIALDELIVSFAGDLVRVENESRRQFRPGQRVLLRVEKHFPLELKLIAPAAGRKPRLARIDVSI